MRTRQSKKAVSAELAAILEALHEQLKKEFLTDFAYTILANGTTIAASNCSDGHVTTIKRAEECDHEWKVRDDSFSHEFGTEIIVVECCDKCGKERPFERDD